MSDTPRTNARVKQMIDNDQGPEGLEYWARDLERELNAANESFRKLNIHTLNLVDRIRRLEEAGDEMMSEPCEYTFEQWTKAKEAKL